MENLIILFRLKWEKNYAEIIAPKRFIGVDGANHCQAYFLYPEKSKEILNEFIWGK